MSFNFGKRLLAYLEPMYFIIPALYGLLVVLFEIIILQKNAGDILSISKLSNRIFGKLWLIVAPSMAAFDQQTLIPKLVAQAEGVVLELGPGSGNQLPRYDLSRVRQIYGIEPNVDLHEALRASIKKAKLDDIYVILSQSAEDAKSLERCGVAPNSVDTILSVNVLCSVPDPIKTVRGLFPYVKPGGKMIVYEHVQSNEFIARNVQNLYGLIWPYLTGNCHLNRQTERNLREAADWSRIDLKSPPDQDPGTPFPRICGELTK